MSSDIQNTRYLVLKWNGDKFQISSQVQNDDSTQVLILDKNKVGIVYFSQSLSSLDQRNMYRQLDSLKRSSFDHPDGGKLKVNDFIEVQSTYTLKNIVRALKMGGDIQAIIDAEKQTKEDPISNVQNEELSTFKKIGDVLYSKELPLFRIDIQFLTRSIRVRDLLNKEVLVEKRLPSFCSAIEPIIGRGTRYNLIIDNKKYELTVDLLDIVHEVKTKALYILNVQLYDSKGYFVGLDEFGTFTIDDDRITLEKTVHAEKLTYGIYLPEEQLFFVTKMDQLECWNWNGTPTMKWNIPVPSMTQGLAITTKIQGRTIFTGHKDGNIQKIDFENGKNIHSIALGHDPIRNIIWNTEGIVFHEKGSILRIGLNGEEQWRTYLPSNKPIVGINDAQGFLWITLSDSTIYKVNYDTGKIEDTFTGSQNEAYSNTAIMTQNWLLYDYPSSIGWMELNNPNNRSNTFIGDTIIRTITTNNTHVVVGEDSGKLILLKRPRLILKEL